MLNIPKIKVMMQGRRLSIDRGVTGGLDDDGGARFRNWLKEQGVVAGSRRASVQGDALATPSRRGSVCPSRSDSRLGSFAGVTTQIY